jgi:hypothetical protein
MTCDSAKVPQVVNGSDKVGVGVVSVVHRLCRPTGMKWASNSFLCFVELAFLFLFSWGGSGASRRPKSKVSAVETT